MPLFSNPTEASKPLAERLRPTTLDEYVGQAHLVGADKLIREIFRSPVTPSLILWGPPGTGKTTLAFLLAKKDGLNFVALSAVTSGIKEVKEVITAAGENVKVYGKKTLLFVDEIHRFNKAQQDAFLPHVEKGTIILIGATTENPSFEIISALLSRCRVVVLKRLEKEDLNAILNRALTDKEKGLGGIEIDEEARDFLLEASDGDARRLLTTLEIAAALVGSAPTITIHHVETALQKKSLVYDKSGEAHYDIISAFIKSMRGSDPDAALYYLARMLEGGEEPLFLARRLVIFASEDVGNADPQAVQVAVACMQSLDFVGMPEGWIPLAQAATYLASAPKSNASYAGYKEAKMDVINNGSLPVPMHLRNAPTKMMKGMGYGKNYKYAHDYEGNIPTQTHLPEKLEGRLYYKPTENGYEARIKEYLEKAHAKRRQG